MSSTPTPHSLLHAGPQEMHLEAQDAGMEKREQFKESIHSLLFLHNIGYPVQIFNALLLLYLNSPVQNIGCPPESLASELTARMSAMSSVLSSASSLDPRSPPLRGMDPRLQVSLLSLLHSCRHPSSSFVFFIHAGADQRGAWWMWPVACGSIRRRSRRGPSPFF
jgi:hypothetical protein